ncbi:hypothetical protein BO85DRAFT_13265 [Aspergillus piperis CBS 112811]|uniref:Uncharacterized protein n=1 Tax=Aspergillus piperis CBS 112811 TaxID=1448313 RepID=A0A8G1VRD2_9EURO|nr:hypothetical protein BO85DRAFT_13265 [Aspergillus piperis CBS 112811]RAH62929.1 hypothetical protein BO85DRAFT_13265 [Aspergillus piperis CBS 112811]
MRRYFMQSCVYESCIMPKYYRISKSGCLVSATAFMSFTLVIHAFSVAEAMSESSLSSHVRV